MEENKEPTVTIKKETLYQGTIAVLILLLIVSILTQGFGLVSANGLKNNDSDQNDFSGDSNTGSSKIDIKRLIDDDPKIGSESAQVLIVEFSDFQCPFCRSFYQTTYKQIKEQYIDTNKVQLVYRDFPLKSIHPAAQKSAEAAQCANDQGQFEQYHNKLFEEQAKSGQGTVSYSVTELKDWAKQIGLNENQFNECLDSGKYEQEVDKDFNDGLEFGITGTPGFIIAKKDGSQFSLISGAQQFTTFKQTIDKMLQ